jgi:hypothetical protein
MRPDNDVVKAVSPELWHEALSQPGKTYAIYVYPRMTLPFKQRSPIAAPGRIEAELMLNLPQGKYQIEWIDTKTGESAKSETRDHPSGAAMLKSPAFENDIALKLTAR